MLLKAMVEKVSIGHINSPNLQFVDDVGALAEEEHGLEGLADSLDKTCTWYKMQLSAKKTKLMKYCHWHLEGNQSKRLELGQASNTSEQLSQMLAQNQRFLQGLYKPLPFLQS